MTRPSPRVSSHRLDPALPMLLFAVAVAVSPEFNFLGFPKVRVSDLLLPVLLMVFAGARATEAPGDRRSARLRKKPPIPLLGPMVGILLWDLSSYFLFSPDEPLRIGALYLVKRAEFFLIYLLGVLAVTSPWAWIRIITPFMMAAPILNLSVLWQLHSNPELRRASGIIEGQETSTALFIVVVLGAALGAWPSMKDRRERGALLLAGVTGVAALMATGSRAGLLCGLVVALLQILRDRKNRGSMLAVLVLLASFAWIAMPEKVLERFERGPEEIASAWRGLVVNPEEMPSAGSSSVAARVVIGQRVLQEVIPQSPIFGLGTGRLALGLVDNMYLTEWIYHGMVGLFLFGTLLVSMFSLLGGIRRKARDPLLKSLAGSMQSVLVALIVSGLAAETFYLIRPMEAYMLLLGLVVGRSRLVEEA